MVSSSLHLAQNSQQVLFEEAVLFQAKPSFVQCASCFPSFLPGFYQLNYRHLALTKEAWTDYTESIERFCCSSERICLIGPLFKSQCWRKMQDKKKSACPSLTLRAIVPHLSSPHCILK